MSVPNALTADEAKERIALILDEGTVELSFHCRSESMPKRGVTMLDIVATLKTGEIRRAPEWDSVYSNWKYRVEGEDTEGDELTAVTLIIETDMQLYIVTVF